MLHYILWTTPSVHRYNKRFLKRYDGNKKWETIKRPIFVDKIGFLLSVVVTIAPIPDSEAVLFVDEVLQGCYAPTRNQDIAR